MEQKTPYYVKLNFSKYLIFIRVIRLLCMGAVPVFMILQSFAPMMGLKLNLSPEILIMIGMGVQIAILTVALIQYPLTVAATREIEDLRNYITGSLRLKVKGPYLKELRDNLDGMHKFCRRSIWWIFPCAVFPQFSTTILLSLKYMQVSDILKSNNYLLQNEVDG